jgi:CRISPR/Cas system CSM-associated protein Csm2 small subunit
LEDLATKIAVREQSLRRVYDKIVERELSKYREDYEGSLKKIAKMSLTLMHFKELPYYNRNNYIKSEVNRKLYANKSERKLDFEKEIDEEEMNEIANANKKIMKMLFPTFDNKLI